MEIDRQGCLFAMRRLRVAAAIAEPLLARRCGPICSELGLGPEDAVRLMVDALADMPEVLAVHAATLRVVLAFRAYVDFSALGLPTFAAAAVAVFLDDVRAGAAPRAVGA